jgi:hypothetical protein
VCLLADATQHYSVRIPLLVLLRCTLGTRNKSLFPGVDSTPCSLCCTGVVRPGSTLKGLRLACASLVGVRNAWTTLLRCVLAVYVTKDQPQRNVKCKRAGMQECPGPKIDGKIEK